MEIYIDDYNLVRIETEGYIDSVYLLDEKLSFVSKEENFQYFKSKSVIPLHLNNEIKVNNVKHQLKIGLVTIKPDFNVRYRYEGVLGSIYSKDNTVFRVFTPVAKDVKLVLNNKTYDMIFKSPIWQLKVEGNLVDQEYYYLVKINGDYEKVIDPYALAGNDVSSVIIDLNQTINQLEEFLFFPKKEQAIIYEGHIRDLTSQLTVKEKKNYLGLINVAKELNMSVLDYIKNLGMTHLQLLPVQDFYEVDPLKKDLYYNWGYNPKQYFVLSSWYSNDPASHYTKINEFKTLVNEAHKRNLGITLDVVYNHVYRRDKFPYDKLVPGYFYRHKDGIQTNSSLVGNDIETTNFMVRKFIVDNLVFLAKTFKLDGFRFDLMGLLDLETMIIIETELKKINPHILLYGEGWNIPNSLEQAKRSNMGNNALFKGYSHFNDFYRDTLNGEQYTKELGYIAGNNKNLSKVYKAIEGSLNIFENSNQAINFVECHDNRTLIDSLLYKGISLKDAKYYAAFANHLILLSKGIPFYQAGQELFRSKDQINDTYNLGDHINGIKWNHLNEGLKLTELINFRNKYLTNYNELDYSFKPFENMVKLKITNYEEKFIVYLKNDFKVNSFKVKEDLIFSSTETTKNNNYLTLTKPGVYILKIKK